MKINDLLNSFEIYKTNEESAILEKIDEPCYLDQFDDREQLIIQNLSRKSLVSKISTNGTLMVVKNEYR